jgi:hypothetical protein
MNCPYGGSLLLAGCTRQKDVENPFEGEAMIWCGEIVDTVEAAK